MKKKLDEAYSSDKSGQGKRILLGLSGGSNSAVAAYLLKIQKYEVIGVTIGISWDSLEEKGKDVLSCYMDQGKIDSIKEFCHQLGIPHILIKSADEFSEEVVENWMASRLSGTKPNPCWSCHELRMRILHQKALEMDAAGIATGHLAKIFHQDSHRSVYVHTSNDELHDQSGLLSRLPREILNHLMLPLSDLQSKEVIKLAENFGITESNKKIQMHECFNNRSLTAPFLEKFVPERFRRPGEIENTEKETQGEHSGIINYQYADELELIGTRSRGGNFMSGYSMREKKIFVVKGDQFIRKKIFLTDVKVSEETSWLEPLKGVLRIHENDFVDCWIYPKNLNSALVEFEVPQKIFEGDIVTLLRKKGKNSKVYLSGKVRYFDEPQALEEEGSESVKVDYSRDF